MYTVCPITKGKANMGNKTIYINVPEKLYLSYAIQSSVNNLEITRKKMVLKSNFSGPRYRPETFPTLKILQCVAKRQTSCRCGPSTNLS